MRVPIAIPDFAMPHHQRSDGGGGVRAKKSNGINCRQTPSRPTDIAMAKRATLRRSAPARRTTALKPVRQATVAPVTQPELVWEDAVAEGKQLVSEHNHITAQVETTQWRMRLGKLAHEITKQWNERKLKKFAPEIGIAFCTVKRARTFYRAWTEDGALAPPLISDTLAQELAPHPDKFTIIAERPNITKAEAREKVKEWREAGVATGPASHRRAEAKRWFKRVLKIAEKAETEAEHQYNDATLREATDPKLRPDVMEGAKALFKIAKRLKSLGAGGGEE
jgi:hypothetical protein